MSTPTAPRGMKYDAGKARLGLLPWAPLRWVARVLEYGALKYRKGNWVHLDSAEDVERLGDALLRHVSAALDPVAPELYDSESGLPHLAHAATNCLFLLTHLIRAGTLRDGATLTPAQAHTFARLAVAQRIRDGQPLAATLHMGGGLGQWAASVSCGAGGEVRTPYLPLGGLCDALRDRLADVLGLPPELPRARLTFAMASGEPTPPEVLAELGD